MQKKRFVKKRKGFRRRKNVKKTHKTSGININNSQSMSLGGKTPFPAKYICKHHYRESLTLTAGAVGVFGTETGYSLNDVFDPRFSAGGHQPYGRDTMATIYGRYKVLGCKVKIVFTDPSADGVVCGVAATTTSDGFSLTGNSYEIGTEKPNVWSAPVNNTGVQTVTFEKYFDIAKFLGMTKSQYRNDMFHLGSSAGTTPASLALIRVANLDLRAAGAPTVLATVDLDYYVQWYDRLTLGQS